MTKIVVDGIIRAMSPLHISAVEKIYCNPEEGRVYYSPGPKRIECTGTRHRSYVVPETETEGSRVGIHVPILPSNGLRGALRRAAARGVEQHLVHERNEKVSWPTYQGMHCGAVDGNPDGVPPSIQEVKAAAEHILMGNFGGGPRLIPSRLRVADGVPVLPQLVEAGYIPDRYAESAVQGPAFALTEVGTIIRNDDVMQQRDPRAEEFIENFGSEYQNEQEAMAARRAEHLKRQEKKDAGEADEGAKSPRGVQAFSFMQYVKPGVPFYTRFWLTGNEAQAGALLAALQYLNHTQDEKGIGGKSSAGFGRYHADLYVQVDGGERVALFSGSGPDAELNDHPLIEKLMNAYGEALGSVSAAEMESFFAKVTQDKGKKSGAKKAG